MKVGEHPSNPLLKALHRLHAEPLIMSIVNIAALNEAKLETDPFPHFCVPNFLSKEDVAKAISDFPQIEHGGLFPVETLTPGSFFTKIIGEVTGPEVAEAVGRKLGLTLTGMDTMLTIRGRARAKDGQIHTDATFKKATLLLYLNEGWSHAGGRLRVLRSNNMDDYTAEVAPEGVTLFGFQCTDNAWHGHLPYEGVRRYIMCNFVEDKAMLKRELARHRMSARLKSLGRMVGIG